MIPGLPTHNHTPQTGQPTDGFKCPKNTLIRFSLVDLTSSPNFVFTKCIPYQSLWILIMQVLSAIRFTFYCVILIDILIFLFINTCNIHFYFV